MEGKRVRRLSEILVKYRNSSRIRLGFTAALAALLVTPLYASPSRIDPGAAADATPEFRRVERDSGRLQRILTQLTAARLEPSAISNNGAAQVVVIPAA
jgi:hypothetical protein